MEAKNPKPEFAEELHVKHPPEKNSRVKDAQWLMSGNNKFKIRTYHGLIDSTYGPTTARAANDMRYALGFRLKFVKTGVFGQQLFEYLMGKEKLPAAYRARKAARARLKHRAGYILDTDFTWAEALAKSWYISVPPGLVVNVERQAKQLQVLQTLINQERRKHGLGLTNIRILSWIRSPAKNRAIGGAKNSQHMQADATDVALQEIDRLMPWAGGRNDFDNISNDIFANGGFGTYPWGSRHVDTRGYRARWSSW